MIYGPYRSHASHSVSTATRAAPRDDEDKRASTPMNRSLGRHKRHKGERVYLVSALEQALRAWLAKLA